MFKILPYIVLAYLRNSHAPIISLMNLIHVPKYNTIPMLMPEVGAKILRDHLGQRPPFLSCICSLIIHVTILSLQLSSQLNETTYIGERWPHTCAPSNQKRPLG